MGFGIALASGFIKEANAIGREKAAQKVKEQDEERAFDIFKRQEKVKSGFRQQEAVAAATVAGDKAITAAKTKATADRLKNMTEIFNKLESWEKPNFLEANPDFAKALGISGFGADSDMAAMHQAIDMAKTTTRIGDVIMPIPSIEMGNAENVETGIRNIEVYLSQNPDVMDALTSDKNKNAASTLIGNLYETFNTNFHYKQSKTGTDGTVVDPKYYDWKTGKLQNFYSLAQKLGVVNAGKGFNPVPSTLGKDEALIPTDVEEESVAGVVVNVADITAEYSTTPENMNQLAAYLGMPQGAPQVYHNMDYVTYGEDAKTPTSAMLADESKMRAVATGSLLVAANTKDMFLLDRGAPRSVLDDTTRILTAAGGGNSKDNYATEDIGAMRRAVFTITKPAPHLAGKPPYALTGISGLEYAEKEKYDIAGHRDQSSANDDAVDMLEELRRVQQEVGTTGLVARGEKFLLGVIGQYRDAKEVFLGGENPASDEFTQNLYADEDGGNATTASMLYKTAERALGSERMKNLSKMDALRLTLAAKMARAVDPSGRLSNQDFEIQLDRLGGTGFFTSQEGNLAKLDTVIAEFKRRQESQRDLSSILAKDEITVEDRRFIKASEVVRKAIAHRRRNQTRVSNVGDDSAGSGEGRKLFEIDFNGTIVHTDGVNVYSDPEGKNDITDQYDAAQEKGSN